jgi:hypothetical protein
VLGLELLEVGDVLEVGGLEVGVEVEMELDTPPSSEVDVVLLGGVEESSDVVGVVVVDVESSLVAVVVVVLLLVCRLSSSSRKPAATAASMTLLASVGDSVWMVDAALCWPSFPPMWTSSCPLGYKDACRSSRENASTASWNIPGCDDFCGALGPL